MAENDHNESYLADHEEVEVVKMLAGIPRHHCTDAEEVESGTHLVAAYQKVVQILQKKKITHKTMICWLSCSFHLTLQVVIDSHLTERRREMFIYHTN